MKIYHPSDGTLNYDCREDIDFQQVAELEASSLDETFQLAQNCLNESYASLGIRSTSIGDIIKTPDGNRFMVMGIGWKELVEEKKKPKKKTENIEL